MTALAVDYNWVSPEAYLASEASSPMKREYVDGRVYAMSGARNIHNLIATNLLVAFGTRLKGKKCRPYNSDTKVRVRMPSHLRFYYPDVQVVCQPNPLNDVYQDSPTVIVEVASKSTLRTDEGEKREAYQSIPSLEVYLIVNSTHTCVTAFHRTPTGFVRSQVWGLEDSIKLDCLKIELSLAEIYEGTSLPSLKVMI